GERVQPVGIANAEQADRARQTMQKPLRAVALTEACRTRDGAGGHRGRDPRAAVQPARAGGGYLPIGILRKEQDAIAQAEWSQSARNLHDPLQRNISPDPPRDA